MAKVSFLQRTNLDNSNQKKSGVHRIFN